MRALQTFVAIVFSLTSPPASYERHEFALGTQVVSRSTFESKLDSSVEQFDTSGRPLVASFLDLAYQFQLPFAFEYVNRAAATQPIDLHFHGEPLRKVLETIVGQVPGYRVSFSAGIVSVYAPSQRSDASSILNLEIEDFQVTQMETRQADMKLFCTVAQSVNPSGMCVGSIAAGEWPKTKITLNMKRAKVREILDAIIAQNGEAAWTVIAAPEKLSDVPIGGLWYIYPLSKPYESRVLDKLRSLGQNSKLKDYGR
jgi:hypothetical protein